MITTRPTVRLAKEQPILRRRRRRRTKPIDMAKVQRDFWRHFDLEKFASDWRRGIGLPAVQ
jgi:hypothetical protein